MFKYILIIVLSLTFIIASFVYIIKNYLIGFKGSDSGFKNFMVYIPIVAAEICFITSAITGYIALNLYNHIRHEINIPAEELEMLKHSLAHRTNEASIILIAGFICVCISRFAFKHIQKEIQKELEKPKKLWNLDKYQ